VELPVWFGKKKDKADKSSKNNDSKESVKKGRGPKKGKHQKKAPLSYTALEPFVDSLYGDNGFKYDNGSEQVGVVLVLPFSEIGGLTTSKADKRDQSKGTFVTAINKGDFEVYFDENQDELEQLIILANTDSIDTLADFSILKNAEFRWAYFSEDGELDETDYVSSMDELIRHRTDLESYFNSIFDEDDDVTTDVSESTLNVDYGSNFENNNSNVSELSTLSDLNGLDDLNGIEEPVFAQVNIPSNDVIEEPVFNEGVQTSEPEYHEPYDFNESVEFDDSPTFDEGPTVDEYDYSDDAYDDSLMSDEITVDEDLVQETISQVLYNGDLELNMPVDRFRDIYLSGANDYLIPYYDNDGSWLTQEANRLIHSANDDIHRRIMSDLDVANSTYVRLLNELSVETAEMFNLKGENEYVDLIKLEDEILIESKTNAEARIAEYEEKQHDEYEKRREAKGDEAKANAMNTYDQQNFDKFKRQLEEHRRTELKNIQSDYNDNVVKIKDRRKSEAQSYYETGVAKILSELGKHYIAIRDAQKDYANKWGDKIIEFLDDNRAQDIARVEVMQRNLENDVRVTQMESESQAKIQSLTEQFNAEVELLKANSSRELEDAKHRIEHLESEKDRLFKDRENLANRTSSDYKALSEKYELVSSELAEARTKAAMFELQQSQLNQRDREIENWKNQVEIIAKANNQNKIAFFCVAVVAVVAAVLIGMITGAQLF
jgi:hypothetical protein